MVIPPSIGVVLVLVGLALFLTDLKVTNHGLPTAGAILSLVAEGLALFGAGVPYSGCCSASSWRSRCSWGEGSSSSWALCAPPKGGRPSLAGRG